MALLQYIQDNDDQNTRSWYGTDSTDSNATTNYKWMDAIYPYVKSEQLFNCPSHASPFPYRYRDGHFWGSYGANVAYYDVEVDGKRTSPFVSRKQSLWESPATTVYVADCGRIGFGGRYEIAWDYATDGNPPIRPGPSRGLPSAYMMSERHLGTCAVLFCDGHAKAQKLENLTKIGNLGYYSAFTVQADPD
jgi:prepilin-type processing-associated H-X9-DG protein